MRVLRLFSLRLMLSSFVLCLLVSSMWLSAQEDESPQLVPVAADFQVNNNTGKCPHYNPRVLSLPDGGFVVSWLDQRTAGLDVYMQRYSASGSPVGLNVKVNEDVTCPDHRLVDMACDSSGNFIIVWHDRTNPDGMQICAQRFNSYGDKTGSNIRLCDTNTEKDGASIAMQPDGQFLVTWGMSESKYIYYRHFSADGQPTGPGQLFPRDRDIAYRSVKSIANYDGSFSLILFRTVKGIREVALQELSPQLLPEGAAIVVAPFSNVRRVKIVPSDSLILIAWDTIVDDDRNDVYARLIHQDGFALTHPVAVRPRINGVRFDVEHVGLTAKNSFMILWKDWRSGAKKYYAREYVIPSNVLLPESLVFPTWNNSPMFDIVIAPFQNELAYVWEDSRNGQYNIYAQLGSPTNHPNDNFLVNDDENNGGHYFPHIQKNKKGDVYVMWRGGGQHVSMRKISADGEHGPVVSLMDALSPRESNFRPRFDVGTNHIVVTWECDDIIYVQRFSMDYEPLGSVVSLAAPKSFSTKDCDVAMGNDDSFVVSWIDRPSRVYSVFAQRFGADGRLVGDAIRIDDDPQSRGEPARMKKSRVEIAPDGSFVVGWLDRRDDINYLCYVQRIGADGSKIGGNVCVENYREHRTIALDINEAGDLAVAWKSQKPGTTQYDVWVKRFSAEGTPISDAIQLNSNNNVKDVLEPVNIAFTPDGSIAACWQAGVQDGRDIVMQLVDSLSNKVGPNVQVNQDVGSALQTTPDIVCVDKQIWTVYEDARTPGAGRNIYASLYAIKADEILAARSKENPTHFEILSNYPNPFNPTTTFEIHLPHSGRLDADIYDMRGRWITSLVAAQSDAGIKKLVWNGLDQAGQPVASGVYSCRFRFDEQAQNKKIVLMR